MTQPDEEEQVPVTSDTLYNSDADYESDDDDDDYLQDAYDFDDLDSVYTPQDLAPLVVHLKEEGVTGFLRSYLAKLPDGTVPSLRKLLYSLNVILPEHLRDPRVPEHYLLPLTQNVLTRFLRNRERLWQYNTVDDAIELFRKAKNIIVVSGAGISTSCGIPDFRSKNGLYSILSEQCKLELDEPEEVFDLRIFRERPEIFYSCARTIWPGAISPGPCHRWINMLESRGVLLRNYTQNIDSLEKQAGVKNVLQCHGSFSSASCLRCKKKVPASFIEPYIASCTVPYCDDCKAAKEARMKAVKASKRAKLKANGKGKAKATRWDSDEESEDDEWEGGEPGVIKPDIVFFHEDVGDQFPRCVEMDRKQVDLMVIIGTSLEVQPVSDILVHIPHSVPQILINRNALRHANPDICLLGDADTIVQYISHRLGWEMPPPLHVNSPSIPQGLPAVDPEDVRFVSSEDNPFVHYLTTKDDLDDLDDVRTGSITPTSTTPPVSTESDRTPSPVELPEDIPLLGGDEGDDKAAIDLEMRETDEHGPNTTPNGHARLDESDSKSDRLDPREDRSERKRSKLSA